MSRYTVWTKRQDEDESKKIIDYIFYRALKFRLNSLLELNSKDITGPIPSQQFPSDHIPLIVNFELMPIGQKKPSLDNVQSDSNSSQPSQPAPEPSPVTPPSPTVQAPDDRMAVRNFNQAHNHPEPEPSPGAALSPVRFSNVNSLFFKE